MAHPQQTPQLCNPTPQVHRIKYVKAELLLLALNQQLIERVRVCLCVFDAELQSAEGRQEAAVYKSLKVCMIFRITSFVPPSLSLQFIHLTPQMPHLF